MDLITSEQAIIGAILIDNDSINQVKGSLLPLHFDTEPCRVIYSAMLELSNEGKTMDLITLNDILEKSNDLDRADDLEPSSMTGSPSLTV